MSRDDVDDDKYKRRSATELLFRWLRSVLGPVASKRRRQTKGQGRTGSGFGTLRAQSTERVSAETERGQSKIINFG